MAVGDLATVKKTGDRGYNWTTRHHAGGGSNILLGVSVIDTNVTTAVGVAGTILRTRDGGASWQSQPSGTLNVLFGVSFLDQGRYARGEDGTEQAAYDVFGEGLA